MLADHDGVDGCRVLEREEREAPRATRGVAHDRARLDLAKLCKVLSQRLCSNHRLALLRAEEQTIVTYVPSVVSQFNPPINILLYNNRHPVANTRDERGTWKESAVISIRYLEQKGSHDKEERAGDSTVRNVLA